MSWPFSSCDFQKIFRSRDVALKSEYTKKEYLLFIFLIIVGSGLYGFTIGLWRNTTQAWLVFIKFPLLILLTMSGTFVLNWTLAQLLGLDIKFKQCIYLILKCYTMISLVLMSLSPVTLFLLYNTPSMQSYKEGHAYMLLKLFHVVLIAFAGIISNLRLYETIEELSSSKPLAKRVFTAWIGGHLLLGSQLSWNLRPFFGNPNLPVQFLRDDALRGNFFENIFDAIVHFL